jgi:hypothetical protein
MYIAADLPFLIGGKSRLVSLPQWLSALFTTSPYAMQTEAVVMDITAALVQG